MPTLVITKTYSDGNVLTEAQLDSSFDSIATFNNVTKLDDDNIQNNAIITALLATSAVTEAKLASNAVTVNKIANNAVTTPKIIDDAVTGAKLNADVVDDSTLEQTGTTLNIKADGVGTTEIIDSAVTNAKRPDLTADQSAGGSDSTTSLTFVDATNVGTATITSTGRPILVTLQSNSANQGAVVFLAATADTEWGFGVRLVRDSTGIGGTGGVMDITIPVGVTTWQAFTEFPAGLSIIDNIAAGTYVYKAQILSSFGDNITLSGARIRVVEI